MVKTFCHASYIAERLLPKMQKIILHKRAKGLDVKKISLVFCHLVGMLEALDIKFLNSIKCSSFEI